MRNFGKLIVIGTTLTVAVAPVLAVEGAVGRTLPGVWVMPQAGVVGPTPGFSFTLMPGAPSAEIFHQHKIAAHLINLRVQDPSGGISR